ncbi:OmpP1/FadL family transporter [Algoriphagus taiwanensis]|uniref:Outer membrane protein transport protein n=1 Tax=Algoriphagus taiwanensis TaxID=1445656 RepID=A0ABQ6PY60_9BACT|nr:outer membrane protein transport protein [Algoriphagus taiwanensis]
MRISVSIFMLLILSASIANAQSGYFEDAFRFSRVVPSGSARIMGVGGTQWSLGGDVSNIAGNPAGLGFFRTSEISLSLGYSDWGVQTQYLDQSREYNTSNFSLPNISYVGAKPKGLMESKAFKGGAWAMSFQRIANFNTEFGYFSDVPGQSSIIDFYLQDSFGIPESQIENFGLTGLAYQTYQINPIAFDEEGNPIPNPNVYDSFVLGLPFQDENIRREGSANQMTFGYGANFNHKLFLGGSLGIRTLNFSSFKVYNEEFVDEPLATSSLQENLFINGAGVNVNLGVIYKPMDNLNLGFVFQTPTWYGLNEEYEAAVFTDYNNYYYEPEDITLGQQDAFSDLVISNYGLNTPLKIGGGATFFFGKKGFISADVDWVDYSTARINSRDFDEGPDNEVIRDIYSSTVNYRVGGEIWLDMFRIRGGYSYLGDPYSNSPGFDQSTQIISGGVGIRTGSFTLDLTIFNQQYDQLYRSYQVLDEDGFNFGPLTEIKNSITSGILTVGFNF